MSQNAELEETNLLLRQQLNSIPDKSFCSLGQTTEGNDVALNACSEELLERNNEERNRVASCGETCTDENTPTSVMSLNRVFSQEDSRKYNNITSLNSQICQQVIDFLPITDKKIP